MASRIPDNRILNQYELISYGIVPGIKWTHFGYYRKHILLFRRHLAQVQVYDLTKRRQLINDTKYYRSLELVKLIRNCKKNERSNTTKNFSKIFFARTCGHCNLHDSFYNFDAACRLYRILELVGLLPFL